MRIKHTAEREYFLKTARMLRTVKYFLYHCVVKWYSNTRYRIAVRDMRSNLLFLLFFVNLQ